MPWIVDAVLLAVFVLCAVFAAKKGLVRAVLEIAAFLLTVILSLQLAAPAAKTLFDSFLAEKIEVKIEEKLQETQSGESRTQIAAVLDSLPDFIRSIAERQTGGVSVLQQKLQQAEKERETAAVLTETLARPICEPILTGVLFLVLSALLGGLLQTAAGFFAKLFRVPIIGTVDRLLGAVFGMLKGALLLYLAVCVLVCITPRNTAEPSALQTAVESSSVVEFVKPYLPEAVFGQWK